MNVQFACLSARISQKLHIQSSPNFQPVTYGHGLVIVWQRCDTLCTSGFVDDVIFANNRPCKKDACKASTHNDSPEGNTEPARNLMSTTVTFVYEKSKRTGSIFVRT